MSEAIQPKNDTETRVQVRASTSLNVLAQQAIATLDILPAPITFCDSSNCCEDCPDINDAPPSESECPYFEFTGRWPVCTREGNSDALLKEFFLKRPGE